MSRNWIVLLIFLTVACNPASELAHRTDSSMVGTSASSTDLAGHQGSSSGVGPTADATEQPTVSLDYDKGAIKEVFADICEQIGAELDADPVIDGKVSLQVEGMALDEVMDWICTSFRCVWRLTADPRTLRVEPAQAAGGTR